MADITLGRVLTGQTRRHDLPPSLGDLRGPASGRLVLPDGVYWGPDSRIDLRYVDDVLKAYEAVLREGSLDEICEIVNATRLREVWRRLVLPSVVRRSWQARFPELRL